MESEQTSILLVALLFFVCLTAVAGMLFIIPTLPVSMIKGSSYASYTVPALALGFLVGGSAFQPSAPPPPSSWRRA